MTIEDIHDGISPTGENKYVKDNTELPPDLVEKFEDIGYTREIVSEKDGSLKDPARWTDFSDQPVKPPHYQPKKEEVTKETIEAENRLREMTAEMKKNPEELLNRFESMVQKAEKEAGSITEELISDISNFRVTLRAIRGFNDSLFIERYNDLRERVDIALDDDRKIKQIRGKI